MTELSVLRGPNYVADQATFEIYRGDRLYKTVFPQSAGTTLVDWL